MWLWMLGLACTGDGPDDKDDTDRVTDTDTAPLVVGPFTSWTDPVTSALRSGIDGASIREGRIHWSKFEDCAPIVAATGTCHGAHPASPYGFFDFPEDVDDGDGVLDYQLDASEAVVFVGHTPPPSRYWSFNQYQYEQYGDDGVRRTIFGTISPALNMLELSTAGSPLAAGARRQAADVPFSDYTVVIFGASQQTEVRVRELVTPLLEAAGYGPELLNVLPMALADDAEVQRLIDEEGMPASEVFALKMGYGDDKDTYNVVLRVAAPEDLEHPYLFSETIDAAVFKVAFDDPPAVEPYPWPVMPKPDETTETEHPWVQEARDAVAEMVQGVLIPPVVNQQLVGTDNGDQKSGGQCINLIEKCGGNNDDARYLRSADRFYMPSLDQSPSGEPYASLFVIGVNHTFVAANDPLAPRVTYNSITLSNYTRGFGIATRLDHELLGSLDYWLDTAGLTLAELGPGFKLDPAERDAIYVVQFARDCSTFNWPQPNPYCIEFDAEVLGACPLDKIWTVERAYLNETTATAPHESSVVEPLVIGTGSQVPLVTFGVGFAYSLGVPDAWPPDNGGPHCDLAPPETK